MKKLSSWSEHAFAALRIVAGLAFAYHGAQKLFGFYEGFTPPFGSQIWLGAVIELAGGLLMALGLRAREAAFLSSGTMAVAYVQFHWKGALGRAFFPSENKGELALVYCFLFLYFACRGSGRFALKPD